MKNPNCDNVKCLHSKGQVRLLPTGAGSNAILCKSCFTHEIIWRKHENLRLDKSVWFPLPAWQDLKIYTGE